MKQKPAGRPSSSEQIIRDIKRKTRKQYSAEEKIRIVLDGLRGEDSILRVRFRHVLTVLSSSRRDNRRRFWPRFQSRISGNSELCASCSHENL